MAHHIRIDPNFVNETGIPNQDSSIVPEFTFHHGHVERVINSLDDLSTVPLTDVPSDVSQLILITPTFEGVVGSGYLKNTVLAQPLLRGFADSMTRGDSVIYTQIGNLFFYLGPLNTTNNPNYSPDHYYNSEMNPNRLFVDDRKDDSNGYNIDFPVTDISKITKFRSKTLDKPYDTAVAEDGSLGDEESPFSDLVLEGRHGNSIQIGSRFTNPYLFIKNNSVNSNLGSVLGLLSFGSLQENEIPFSGLSSDQVVEEAKTNEESYTGYEIGVGNDSTEVDGIPRQDRFNINYGNVKSTPEEQKEFDQIIMFSDRITFDANDTDLTMSAKRNINVGSGQNISITSKKHTLIQSENIYLGKQSKEKTEPMVLGEELRKILEDIVSVINGAHALVQGVPIPLVDAGGAPLRLSSTVVGAKQSIEEILSKLEIRKQNDDGVYQDGITPFLSKHHFIEINNREQNNEG
tara:strand:- start:349 stop:1734 length:1386 start_codon:yes stop_codon:yes gene_type:complete